LADSAACRARCLAISLGQGVCQRPQALAELAKVGFAPVFGARPLERAIQQRIEDPVSKLRSPSIGEA